MTRLWRMLLRARSTLEIRTAPTVTSLECGASHRQGSEPERRVLEEDTALTQTPDQSPGKPPPLKVVVVGNSNSVLRWSYARLLEKIPNLAITNRSIGASPNVVLLDYLALEQHWDYDFVIVETAVVDYLQGRNGGYTKERSAETLELFIRFIRARSDAEIIILTIPTREALLAPGSSWEESLYQAAADRMGVPILDGFRLVRSLVGRPKFARVQYLVNRATRLAQAFGLDGNVPVFLAWRTMRDQQVSSNALGIFSFFDHAHLSPSLMALISSLLAEYMTLTARRAVNYTKLDRPDRAPTVIASTPRGGTRISRTSSLVSRDLVKLVDGESARYQCPPGFLAYGMMVNSGATSCFLRFESGAGVTPFDLRYPPSTMSWIGIVMPILPPIGDGEIVVTVQQQPDTADAVRHVASTGGVCKIPVAEIGELILVHRDWRDILAPNEDDERQAFQIDSASWAQPIIAGAALSAARIGEGIEAESHRVESYCFKIAAKLLNTATAPLSSADQARLMVLLGMIDGLEAFVDDACGRDPGNSELDRMQAVLRDLRAEDELKPKDLLERAQGLARSGATVEAEQVYAEGMIQFPGEIAFFIENAWIPCHQKNWAEGRRRWQNILDYFPNHPVSYLGMVTCLARSGDMVNAGNVLALAATLFPDNAQVTNHYLHREVAEIANRAP